jgi:ABC-2 type transport system permease protein
MLTNALVNNIAFKVLTIMGFIPIWTVLYFLFKPDFSSVTWTGILFAIPAMILGFLVSFLLSAAITSLAFWTTRVYSVHEFYYALMLLFSGQFVPLTLMPRLIQDIAQFLPFQLLIYYPVQLILGNLSSAQIVQGYVAGLVWLLISIVLFNWIWRNGVKQYSAVGA